MYFFLFSLILMFSAELISQFFCADFIVFYVQQLFLVCLRPETSFPSKNLNLALLNEHSIHQKLPAIYLSTLKIFFTEFFFTYGPD